MMSALVFNVVPTAVEVAMVGTALVGLTHFLLSFRFRYVLKEGVASGLWFHLKVLLVSYANIMNLLWSLLIADVSKVVIQ